MLYSQTDQNCFQKTVISETGLSNCHKLVSTIFRSTFINLHPKTTSYESCKSFNKQTFVRELDKKLIKGNIYKTDDSYSKLIEFFLEALQKHAPTKPNTIKGNHAPFTSRKLSKVIMNESRIKNKYLKWPSRKNYLTYKKIKKICNNLIKNQRKGILKKLLAKGLHQVNLFGGHVKGKLKPYNHIRLSL